MANWFRRSDEEPYFWLGRYPVHLTGLIILLHVGTFTCGALSLAFGHLGWMQLLSFHSTEAAPQGKIWQWLTYPFVHAQITPYFALEMLMFFWFGRELETHLGRKGFLLLYVCLILCPALLLSAMGPFWMTTLAGSGILHFSIFLAFAALFPEAELLFGILAKWYALALLAIYTLADLAYNSRTELFLLWVSAGIAVFAVRAQMVSGLVEWVETYKERAETTRVLQKKAKLEQKKKEQEKSIDEILEKISRNGLKSLSANEKQTLENARTELLKKDRPLA